MDKLTKLQDDILAIIAEAKKRRKPKIVQWWLRITKKK